MRKIGKICGLILLMTFALIVFVGCEKDNKTTLTAPTDVAISEDHIITFSAVEHASSYQAKIISNGGTPKLLTVVSGDSLATTLDVTGAHEVAVRAIGDNKKYSNSAYSEAVDIFTKAKIVISLRVTDPQVEIGTVYDLTSIFSLKKDNEDIVVTEGMLTHSVNFNVAGTYVVTLHYEDDGDIYTKDANFIVFDSSNVEFSIVIANPYTEVGTTFDLLQIFSLKINGTLVPIIESMITHNVDFDVIGDYEVMVSYVYRGVTYEQTATFKVIEVVEPIISVKNENPQAEINEAIDLTQLFSIKIADINIPVTETMITHDVDYSQLGSYEIVLTYIYKGESYTKSVTLEVVLALPLVVSVLIENPKTEVNTTYDLTQIFSITKNTTQIPVTSDMISAVDFNVVGSYEVTLTYVYKGTTYTSSVVFKVTTVLEAARKEVLEEAINADFTNYQLTFEYKRSGNPEYNIEYSTQYYFTTDWIKVVNIYEGAEDVFYVKKTGTDSYQVVYYNAEYEIWLENTCTQEVLAESFGVYFEMFDIMELSVDDFNYNAGRSVYTPATSRLTSVGEMVFGSFSNATQAFTKFEVSLLNRKIYYVSATSTLTIGSLVLTIEYNVYCEKYGTIDVDLPPIGDIEDLVEPFEYFSPYPGAQSLSDLYNALNIDWLNYLLSFSVQYINVGANYVNSFTQDYHYENGFEKFYYKETSGKDITELYYEYYESINAYFEIYKSGAYYYPFPATVDYVQGLAMDFYLKEDAYAWAYGGYLEADGDGFYVPVSGSEYLVFTYFFGEVRNYTSDRADVNYFKLRVEQGKLVGIYAQVKVTSASGAVEYYTISTTFSDYDAISLGTIYMPTEMDLIFAQAETSIKDLGMTITNGTTSEGYIMTIYQGNMYVKTDSGQIFYIEKDSEYIAFTIYYVDPDSKTWETTEAYLTSSGAWVYDESLNFSIPTVLFSYWARDLEGYLVDIVPASLILDQTIENLYHVDSSLAPNVAYEMLYGYICFNGEFIKIEYKNVVSVDFVIEGSEIKQVIIVYNYDGQDITITINVSDGRGFRFPQPGDIAGLTEEQASKVDSLQTLTGDNYSSYFEYYATYDDYTSNNAYAFEGNYLDGNKLNNYLWINGSVEDNYFELDNRNIISAYTDRGIALTADELEFYQQNYVLRDLSWIRSEMFNSVDSYGWFGVSDEYIDFMAEYFFGYFGWSGAEFLILQLYIDGDVAVFFGYTVYEEYLFYSFEGYNTTVIEWPTYTAEQKSAITQALGKDYSNMTVNMYSNSYNEDEGEYMAKYYNTIYYKAGETLYMEFEGLDHFGNHYFNLNSNLTLAYDQVGKTWNSVSTEYGSFVYNLEINNLAWINADMIDIYWSLYDVYLVNDIGNMNMIFEKFFASAILYYLEVEQFDLTGTINEMYLYFENGYLVELYAYSETYDVEFYIEISNIGSTVFGQPSTN